MCYKDTCLYRTPKGPSVIQKICLVLAIINAIANLLLFFASLYIEYRIYFTKMEHKSDLGFKSGHIVWTLRYKRDAIDDFTGDQFLPFLWLEMIAVALFSLATIFFSVLLCIGICKRQPEHVKAYFVYGFWITILIIAVSVLQVCFGSNIILGIGGLCGCTLHTLFLVIVHQTHKEVFQEVWFFDYLRLQEAGIIDSATTTTPFVTCEVSAAG